MAEDSIISKSVEQTRDYGRKLAATLKPGDIVALVGPLGAGKTHLVQGLITGLGGDAEEVASPTFALIREYTSRALKLPVYHMDFYRLESPEEALAIGLDDYFEGEGVTVVEWADRFPELFPKGTRWLEIDLVDCEPDQRTIRASLLPPDSANSQ